MPTVQRIIDANSNRAREAMRVMEDAARFTLNDRALASSIKHLRHDFVDAIKSLGDLSAHRDTLNDVGTSVTAQAETQRDSIAAVVVAASKRLAEALRCCEEYGKLVNIPFAACIKQLRYRAYTIEQQLADKLAPTAVRQWKLCVLITESLCTHHDWLDVAKLSIDAGADCIQLREKDLPDDELFARAARLVESTQSSGATIIINDRADVALAAGCHGVHLGQNDMPIDAVRRIAGRQLIVGVSTHNMTEARRAIKHGADYYGVGAVFATQTKRRKPAGLTYVQKFVREFPGIPHLAIGGIDAKNAAQVAQAGARGLAVSAAICGVHKIRPAVRNILKALH